MIQAPKTLYVIAGEPSGDALGGEVVKALHLLGSPFRLVGVGGESLQAQGLSSLFPMQDLSVMGLFEVLPHLPHLLTRRAEVIQDLERLKPDLLLTIDSPGFTFAVAKKAKAMGIRCVHYTAPTVWAWRPGRALKIQVFRPSFNPVPL